MRLSDVVPDGSFVTRRRAVGEAATVRERVLVVDDDGTGYSRRLKGHDIPIEGRITAVADVFDAPTNERVYRPALPHEEALEILDQGRGSQFNTIVLDAFYDLLGDAVEPRAT
jgi:HD-GYP domain-containing protein (c-di-GMP phosphodiesterase class II)